MYIEVESNIGNNVPEIEYLKNRFNFIQNKVLKTNLSISFQYIIFLISLESEIKLQGPITYSIFKNIILYTVSIIEDTLHYTLDTLIKNNTIDKTKVLPKEDKYLNKKILFTTDENIDICGVHHKKVVIKLKNTDFMRLNRACKKANIINIKQFDEIERLREKRNRIHLAGLEEVDDYYEQKDIIQAFDTAKHILKTAEAKLNNI